MSSLKRSSFAALSLLVAACFDPITRDQRIDAGPTLTCGGGLTACTDVCVDLRTADDHCGQCGQACGPGRACAGSRCFTQTCGAAECAPGSVCFNAQACLQKSCVDVTCPQDQACYDGKCLPRQCGATLCPAGSICLDGACFDPACAVTTCPTGTVCQAGQCLTPSCTDTRQNGSESDVDCGGSCPGCAAGARCDGGLDCVSHFCASGRCSACAGPSDCVLAGETCINGACAIGCTTSATCTGGQVCRADAGVCGPCGTALDCAVPLACTASQLCGACTGGQYCRPGQGCLDGGACGACVGGDQCAPGLGCRPGGVCGACTSGTQCASGKGCSDAGACGPCATGDQCATGQGCIGGGCGACSLATQCAAGQGCKADAGLCGACSSAAECSPGQGCAADAGTCGQCRQGEDCLPGQGCRSDGGTCGACGTNRDCPVNQYCTGASTCAPCTQPGQCGGQGYWNCASGTCQAAGPGYYAPGDDTRSPCLAGSYCSTSLNFQGTGDGTCTAGASCPAGSSTATGAGVCAANTWSNAGAATCSACPANSATTGTAAADHAGPAACLANPGYYGCETGTCSPVGLGYFSAGGSNVRTACGTGTYSATTTAAACSSCTNQPANASAVTYASSTTLTSNTCPYATVTCTSPFVWDGTSSCQDITPAAFSFTDLTGQALSSPVTSNIVAITGVTGTVATSITGASAEYRVCADATCSASPAFGAAAASLTNGQYLQLRVTTSAAFATGVSATMTVGAGSTTWTATTAAQDTTPNAFSFTDLTGQALSTPVTSNIVQVAGITGSVSISISAGAFRVCADATCSAAPAFGSGASTLTNGQYVQLQLTTSAAFTTGASTTLTIGTGAATWTVTTLGQDTTPNAFSFTDLTGQALSTPVSSNIVQVTGITGSVSISISAGAYRVCADATCSAAPAFGSGASTLTNGQYVQLQRTTSGAFSTGVATTLTIGTGNTSWTVTTVGQDTTPDAFSFTDLTGQALSTPVSSNIVQVTGLTGSVSISISAGAYRVCADATCSAAPAFGAGASTLTNGQYVQLQRTTSGAFSTGVGTTLTIGTGNTTWTVTTLAQDTTPNAFGFTDLTGQALSTPVTSNIVQITGITGSVSVSISAGAYRVCADATCSAAPAFGAGASTLTNGQYVQLQRTTSGAFSTGVGSTLTIGTGNTTWTVTTLAQDITPNAFSFSDQSVGTSSVATSNIIQISGITGSVSATIGPGGGTFRVCGDATCSTNPVFSSAGSTITNGQYLQLRITAGGSAGQVSSTTMTVGTGSTTWNVTAQELCGLASFGDVSGFPPGTLYMSPVAPVTNISTSVGTGTANFCPSSGGGFSCIGPSVLAEYQICNASDCSDTGTWFTTNTGVSPGQYLRIRFTPPAPSTEYYIGIGLGTCGANFHVTTGP